MEGKKPMSLKTIRTGNLEYLTAQGISVPHCFTTRYGGVSRGYLESLNIGASRGDRPENVVENYRILGNALGFAPEDTVFARQTHTDTVRLVGRDDRGTGLFRPPFAEPCDALITNDPGVALVVFTADCTPILLYDPVTGGVGAVHAGWRGTAADIAGKTVEKMRACFGTRPENIRAAIGPNIGMCCFETDRDVPDAMTAALGNAALPHIRQTGEKFHVDLKQINALFLRRRGVTHIEISGECTACQYERFWSYRRVGSQRGSQGAIILCQEEKK